MSVNHKIDIQILAAKLVSNVLYLDSGSKQLQQPSQKPSQLHASFVFPYQQKQECGQQFAAPCTIFHQAVSGFVCGGVWG